MSRGADADLSWRHPAGETLVFQGQGAGGRARPWLTGWVESRHVFLVTTPRVRELCGVQWMELLESAREVVVLEVKEGEAAKTAATATRLWEAILGAGGRRDSRVVGLGGGSVGDLAGFVAATFLRGVEFTLAPTTLLAQVDASIGGKTGIDLPQGKNSVGAFHHPAAVVADVAWLSTLSYEEMRSGLVEILKVGAAEDLALFERVEAEHREFLEERQAVSVADLVRSAIAAKIRVVEADPAEGDRRRVLNLGHTMGHAIETVTGYQGLRHGEAVAYGLVFAARLAALRGGDPAWLSRLVDLVEQLALPPLPALEVEALLSALQRDKKATREGVFWVLPIEPGRVEITNAPDRDTVRSEVVRFLEQPLALR